MHRWRTVGRVIPWSGCSRRRSALRKASGRRRGAGHTGRAHRQGTPVGHKQGREVDEMRAELFLLEPDVEELGWQDRALCAQTDPEAFFPEKGGSTREAKKVCLTCEVRDDCLEYALMNDERFGIWGGLSERERRKLKKRAV